MTNMSAIVKFWQHAQQAETADRAPANEFDERVRGISIGGDEHGAAGVFAVVEGEKEAEAVVPILIVVATKGESAAAKLRNANKHAEKISERAERLEVAVGQDSHIGRKSNTQ